MKLSNESVVVELKNSTDSGNYHWHRCFHERPHEERHIHGEAQVTCEDGPCHSPRQQSSVCHPAGQHSPRHVADRRYEGQGKQVCCSWSWQRPGTWPWSWWREKAVRGRPSKITLMGRCNVL